MARYEPDSRILTAVNAGLRFISVAHNSWFSVSADLIFSLFLHPLTRPSAQCCVNHTKHITYSTRMESSKCENKLAAIETPLSLSETEIAVTNKMENLVESEVAPAIEEFKDLTIVDHIATEGSAILKIDIEEPIEDGTQHATESEVAAEVENFERQSDQIHITANTIQVKAAPIAETESQDEAKFNANPTIEADVKDDTKFNANPTVEVTVKNDTDYKNGASVIEIGAEDTAESNATSAVEAAVENDDKLEVASATEFGAEGDTKLEIAPSTAEPDIKDATTEVGAEDAPESEAASIIGADTKHEAEFKQVSTTEVDVEEHEVAQVSSELPEETIDSGTDTVRVTLQMERDENGSGTIATVLEVKPFNGQDGEPEGPAPGLNPYFEAEIRGQRYDTEMAIRTLVEDMDRCEREGDLDVRCISCDEVGHGMTCGKCKHTTYCSPDCQRRDCKPIRALYVPF